MQEAVKKARERAYLERFREKFADFPEGEVVSFEHPDFLIKTQSRRIGIELTEPQFVTLILRGDPCHRRWHR